MPKADHVVEHQLISIRLSPHNRQIVDRLFHELLLFLISKHSRLTGNKNLFFGSDRVNQHGIEKQSGDADSPAHSLKAL